MKLTALSMKFGNSLNAVINKRIRQEYPQLFPHNFTRRYSFFRKCLSRDGYLYVALTVIAFVFIFAIIKLPYLDFILFKEGTAALLIDQRTSNVATIIGMCLTVTSVLFANLAIKDRRSYKLAFEGSLLYLVIYYSLTVILCLIVISTLRNTIEEHWYNRFVLSVTYLTLLIPIGIAYLFRVIIKFANPEEILLQFKKEYLLEVRSILYLQMLTKLSTAEFEKLMKRQKIKQVELDFTGLTDVTFVDEMPTDPVPQRLIKDIDLHKLNWMLKNSISHDGRTYSSLLSLNSLTNEQTTFIWPIPVNRNGRNVRLEDCLKLSEPNKILAVKSQFEDYFEERLEEALKEKRVKKIDEVLSVIEEVYKLQMKCT